jgi:hypothetical protein
MTTSIGAKMTRKIGLKKIRIVETEKLKINFLLYLQRSTNALAIA